MGVSPTDRAALDAQYNLRAAVPAHADYFAWYDRASEAFRARWAAQSRPDLAYGPGPRARIDLYLPDHPGLHPAMLFIHGGYWHSQDRKRYAFLAEPFVEAGVAVGLLGYDLAPALDLDAIVDQVRAGFAWLWARAPELALDRARIGLAGHSAGGHLVAMLLATDWPGRGLPAAPIAAACPISGVFDLTPIRGCYLNDVLALTPDQVRRLSPLHLPVLAPCPILVAVGGRETPAFLDQSATYVRALRRAGLPAADAVVAGLDHFGMIKAMARPDAPAVSWLLQTLRSAL